MNYNLFGEVYDLSISPDRIAIGNYLCILKDGEAEKTIEVEKIDNKNVWYKDENNKLQKVKYENLIGIPLTKNIIEDFKHGESVTPFVTTDTRIKFALDERFAIPLWVISIKEAPFAAIRCVHEFQNLSKFIKGVGLTSEKYKNWINGKSNRNN